MFEASMVDDKGRTAKPYTVSLSLVLQVGVAAAAVAYPLLRIEPLPMVKLRAPSQFSRAVEIVNPQPQPVRARAAVYRPPLLTLPTLRPRPEAVDAPTIEAPVLDSAPTGPAVPYVPGVVAGSGGSGSVEVAPPAPPPVKRAEVAKPAEHKGPVTVGGRVRQPQLIREVKPAYPRLAVASRTQGTVRIEAVIARDGTVRDARVVSGHPLLVAAALDAVRQWRYQPTILNDEPVEVALALDVNFTLSQ
jgi:protein TonB